MSVRRFGCGWCLLETDADRIAEVLDLCRKYDLAYSPPRVNSADGTVRWEMSARAAAFLIGVCEEEEYGVRVAARGGLPHLLARYRRRIGLLIGGLMGLSVLLASFGVVWDIRIEGNEQMSLREVREELTAAGLYVGLPLSELDAGQMAIQIQLASERLSWVSINMNGTVAYVEIRERTPTPPTEPLAPSNLIARHEGIVEELEIYRGVPVVKAGQAVREGELLVSGLYDSQSVGWRVTRAAGKVMARTEHVFEVDIPLKYEEKEYDDTPIVKKTLIFFEKEIKLFKNSGILGTTCDKIEDIDGCMVGEGVSLPVSVRTEYCFPYRYRSLTRGYEQAQAVAYHELERRIAQEITEGVLLRKEITPILTEDTYRLQCRVWCLENIAQQNPFTVESLSQ